MVIEQTSSDVDEASAVPLDWVVSGEHVRVWEDEYHILHVEVRGEVHDDVRPRRVFPLSAKASYISFLGEKDKEVVLLSDPAGLDGESRAALAHALARVYYSATILRVDEIAETMGVSFWHVLTDHGYAKFEVVDRTRHIHSLSDGRFMITDADGNRFEIPCLYDLDEHSQRLIETET